MYTYYALSTNIHMTGHHPGDMCSVLVSHHCATRALALPSLLSCTRRLKRSKAAERLRTELRKGVWPEPKKCLGRSWEGSHPMADFHGSTGNGWESIGENTDEHWELEFQCQDVELKHENLDFIFNNLGFDNDQLEEKHHKSVQQWIGINSLIKDLSAFENLKSHRSHGDESSQESKWE